MTIYVEILIFKRYFQLIFLAFSSFFHRVHFICNLNELRKIKMLTSAQMKKKKKNIHFKHNWFEFMLRFDFNQQSFSFYEIIYRTDRTQNSNMNLLTNSQNDWNVYMEILFHSSRKISHVNVYFEMFITNMCMYITSHEWILMMRKKTKNFHFSNLRIHSSIIIIVKI